ncbi:MAG: 2-hydroxyacyl-CoA dehydratase, partial [bacterium]
MSATGLPELLQRVDGAWRDPTLGPVREWKRRSGGLVIGYMPIYAPRELLWAQGVLPVGLMGGGDDLEIIRGDAYFQSYICHIPRSTIELGLCGSLDCLDGMIFPAICDVVRNLSGMWQMLFPEKLTWYLDVPQDFRPDLGGSFYRRELERLAEALARRGAEPYDAARLRAAIATYNENRAEVRALHGLRRERPWLVPTHELYALMRAGLVLPPEEHTGTLRAYRDTIQEDPERKPMDQARVVVAGSFCEQPPIGLIKTLERSGCYIVDDDFVQIHRWIRGDVATDGDPLENLVRAFLE